MIATGDSFDEVVLPGMSTMRKMWSRRRACGPFDISGRLPAGTGVRGSSGSFATPGLSGAATACTRQPTRSTKSGTALDRGLTLKACCFRPMTSGLSRARQAFRGALHNQLKQFGTPERARPQEQEGDELLV